MTPAQQAEVKMLGRAMQAKSEAIKRYQRTVYRQPARRDNGPTFTAMLVAALSMVGAGWWLAVVLAGIAGK